MNMNIDREWLLAAAEREGNGIISVGGLVSRLRDETETSKPPARRFPTPPPALYGLWLDDGGPDDAGGWVQHTNGPRSGPMVFETLRDAEIAAEYETREMEASSPIRPMLIGVAPGEGKP